MVIIDQTTNDVAVTRGDYAALVFCAYEDDGVTLHELQNGDIVQLQVCKKYGNPEPTFSTDGTITKTKSNSLSTTEDDYTIEIQPADTKGMKFGDYNYDVSIITPSGQVCTYIGDDGDNQPKFTILKEAGGGNE